MSGAKISVIIPVFNRVQSLLQCIDSILSQTFQGYEVVLVDDGSTDGSWEMLCALAQKDSRFSAYRLEKNGGAGPARNFGIEKASGKYCLFCDSDDVYPPYAFQVLFELAEKYQADVASGNLFRMDGELRCYLAPDGLQTALLIKEEALVRNLEHPTLWWPVYHPKCLISRALLKDNQIRYPDLRLGEDPIFLAKVLCAAQSIAITPHAVYFYRIVGKNPLPDARSRLSFLSHLPEVLDVFLRAGQVHCACLCYAISMEYAWHSFAHWIRMSRQERAEEHAMFTAYVEKMRPYAPWERDYAPYSLDIEELRRRERVFLKYGHGCSCLRKLLLRWTHQGRWVVSRLRSVLCAFRA